jgi:hypothetical protein
MFCRQSFSARGKQSKLLGVSIQDYRKLKEEISIAVEKLILPKVQMSKASLLADVEFNLLLGRSDS